MQEILTEFKSDDIMEGNQQTFLTFNKKASEMNKIPLGLFYSDVNMISN